MVVFEGPVSFEWDDGNWDKNRLSHGVTPLEAEEAFINHPKFAFADGIRSWREPRYGLFGMTDAGRLLAVVFTVRRKKVRVISARDMNRKEKKAYEEIQARFQV